MTEGVHLAPAEPKDIPAILSMQAKAFGAHASLFDVALWTKESPEELLTDLTDMTVLVAKSEEGEILGCVRARSVEGIWLIRKLSVSPSHQKNGIGLQLMQAIEERTPPSCHKISVCTMLRLGENVRFFLDCGYIPDYLMSGHYNRLHLICFYKIPETKNK